MRSAQRREGGGAADGWVFTRENGNHWSPSYVSHTFRRLIEKAALPPVRFHDLRHGAATPSLAAGNDLKTVLALLGHASIVLTADTYTSVVPSLSQAGAEATASLVRRAGYDRGRKICRSGRYSWSAAAIPGSRTRSARHSRWREPGPDPQRSHLGLTDQQSPPTTPLKYGEFVGGLCFPAVRHQGLEPGTRWLRGSIFGLAAKGWERG
ncbi:tyrosine-type recombinase/integrase [Amycolatopsis saalfeldensis]|uniref:tyrosine-type recombinase/integrase n=1 Tax=Amycolatopsis saalfeldensis TaxID=394193 RepID=UPI003CCC078B